MSGYPEHVPPSMERNGNDARRRKFYNFLSTSAAHRTNVSDPAVVKSAQCGTCPHTKTSFTGTWDGVVFLQSRLRHRLKFLHTGVLAEFCITDFGVALPPFVVSALDVSRWRPKTSDTAELCTRLIKRRWESVLSCLWPSPR